MFLCRYSGIIVMHSFNDGWKYERSSGESVSPKDESRHTYKPESGAIHWALYIVIGMLFLVFTLVSSSPTVASVARDFLK